MSSEIEELETKLAELDNYLAWVRKIQEDLSERSRSLKSKEFIRVNRITRKDVHDSNSKDVPFFGTIQRYGNWLSKEGITEKWCTWNGYLHLTSDVKERKMDVNNLVGRYADVPE